MEPVRLTIDVAYNFSPDRNSVNVSRLRDHFGIPRKMEQHIVAKDLSVEIFPGDLILITGDSGSGKSSVMREIAAELDDVCDINQLELGKQALIDALDLSFEESMKLYTQCGLGEARLLLRTPVELSEGQRYRFRLALALSRKPNWILADEFTASLDRTTASVIAFNLGKISAASQTGFLLATTHRDVISDLQPNLHLECRSQGAFHMTRSTQGKKCFACWTSAGLVKPPSPTGRISLGGIIDPTQ